MTRRLNPRRGLTALLAAPILLAGITLTPSVARADDASTLTVVGTSDVFDSGLVQSVIKPGFEAADPGVTLNYVSKGTGAAIAAAEAGTASALLVHAASLENQFVAAGYSNEPFGRAIFYGDYVLLGPANDPAKVGTSAPHDIVKAFQLIAAAGAKGTANFVSRGGTPGTTVQEHAIWALTTGVTTCAVGDVNGGGVSPSTSTAPCPGTIPYPTWYHATGLTQGPNVLAGDTCNFTGGGCYVFTDRGTFNFLQSQGSITSLHIVTRGNSATAVGGNTLLVNSFHAYAINPAKFAGQSGVQLNTTAAEAFLNWITSPAAQSAVAGYLFAQTNGDPPFIPDAAPSLTASQSATTVATGKTFKVTGKLANVVTGTPPLNGVTVSLNQTPTGSTTSTVVKTAVTNATGGYTLTYAPKTNANYTVSVGAITKVENSTLSPVFADELAPTSTFAGHVDVQSAITLSSIKNKKGVLTIKATLKPAPIDSNAVIQVYGNFTSLVPTQGLNLLGTVPVPAGNGSLTFTWTVTRGQSWTIMLGYNSPNQFLLSDSARKAVNVP